MSTKQNTTEKPGAKAEKIAPTTGKSDFQDSQLKQARRRAFDNPTLANLDALIATARIAVLDTQIPLIHACRNLVKEVSDMADDCLTEAKARRWLEDCEPYWKAKEAINNAEKLLQ